MTTRKRYKVSYVLDSNEDKLGHRLNVNCLALGRCFSAKGSAPVSSALYSGGRDGQLFRWDVGLDYAKKPVPLSSIQAHSSWINDIAVTSDSQGVISCSSDLTVKLWKPHVSGPSSLTTIGEHNDYVKRLSLSKDCKSPWVVSGGLDSRVIVWDYNVGQEVVRFEQPPNCAITVGPRSGVYSLATNNNIIANGGIQKDIQLWDCVSKKRITDLVGHTDTVRDILISEDGRTILTASSDATIKLWSLRAQKCLFSFLAHSDSVWSLFSEHPDLKVFYAGDRSGLITRTDIRDTRNNQSCSAICKQDSPVSDLIARQSFIWSTASDSSIHQWKDKSFSSDNSASSTIASPSLLPPLTQSTSRHSVETRSGECPTLYHDDAEDIYYDLQFAESLNYLDVNRKPEYTITGGLGLERCRLLSDRRRVLTEDTVGKMCLWDIISCKKIEDVVANDNFDKVAQSLDTLETLPRWASVNCFLGILAVTLDENHYMDTEVYADECLQIKSDEFIDKRINLGVWLLKNLFSPFIYFELQRDAEFRKNVEMIRANVRKQSETVEKSKNRSSVTMPVALSPLKLRPRPSAALFPNEPLTPASLEFSPTSFAMDQLSDTQPQSPFQPSSYNPIYTSAETESLMNAPDYFSIPTSKPQNEGSTIVKTKELDSPKREGSFLGRLKKFGRSKSSRNLSLGSPRSPTEHLPLNKSINLNPILNAASPPLKSEANNVDNELNSSPSSFNTNPVPTAAQMQKPMRTVSDLIERLHEQYVNRKPEEKATTFLKQPFTELTPQLDLSDQVTVIISEESRDAGSSKDIFRCTIGNMENDADALEKIMPYWLGKLLLVDDVPSKNSPTVGFSIQPSPNSKLPSIVSETTRLSANAMLRVQKIMDYTQSKLSQLVPNMNGQLEIRCKDVVVTPKMTLATVKTRLWRSGDDVIFQYNLNPDAVAEVVQGTQKLDIKG
ncbi:WDR48 family WD repeat protein [Schizosaccharomyces cryophilus OY26]|uniref:WDR48 family WD repeat protein n=1 Tax=Schizosaccharomyces cryophilus (strain OY26 / ATCC MYA-4695 / CBS 11777 / NBRC 106824 / NRRL Y48691) TaxID=653667 RepID=S9VNX6_SCHCR|nr:WDR48 family WD repeat protein [Schizosaccharomyces cryophilus OY26]EPY49683.1 WDR48 family WD repeat protein [Schizosaccharomyces cryophilus OY26]